ncbi:NAD(P)/FAD-dependent oxidoreductase [Brevibacillus sp. SYSU BS000544]|uniref:NAD(P)/FAD-dependent oxidoreductase n=1 Tax=Brevibacillus sp. SYSU BS000544 TaxID=3416443 RepID=UPI003CE4B41F
MEKVQVLIVGAGMGGVSAAIWCKRLGLHAVLLERESHIGGQLKQIQNEIWDFPPYTFANGMELLTELEKNSRTATLDIRLQETVINVDVDNHVVTTDKRAYQTDFLIIATGIKPNTLPVLENSALVLPPWFSTTSQGEYLQGKKVLIIGGGDRAVESGYNLSAFASHVWLAVRGSQLRARPEWALRLQNCSNVTILYQTQLVRTEENTSPTGVWLVTGDQKEPCFMEIDCILPRIGSIGNNDLHFLRCDLDGFLRVDENQLTNVDWIYGIGDVTNGSAFASLALAAGQAMKAAKHISLRLKEIT